MIVFDWESATEKEVAGQLLVEIQQLQQKYRSAGIVLRQEGMKLLIRLLEAEVK